MSRYAVSHGRNALYCRLKYDVGIRNMSSSKVSPGKHIWYHHLSSIAPELISKVDVLKDMVMLGENIGKGDFTFSDKETELIHTVCTNRLVFITFSISIPAHLLICVFLFSPVFLLCVFISIFCAVPCVRFYNNNNNNNNNKIHVQTNTESVQCLPVKYHKK